MTEAEPTTYDALADDLSSRTTVVERPDGSASIVRRFEKGAVQYDVYADGGRTLLVTTPHPDLASHVYDSHDGTVRPWDARYLPRGGGGFEKGTKLMDMRVLAVGATAVGALEGLADSLGYDRHKVEVDHVEEGDGRWEARFTAGGDGMKAGGLVVPGGYVVTDRG